MEMVKSENIQVRISIRDFITMRLKKLAFPVCLGFIISYFLLFRGSEWTAQTILLLYFGAVIILVFGLLLHYQSNANSDVHIRNDGLLFRINAMEQFYPIATITNIAIKRNANGYSIRFEYSNKHIRFWISETDYKTLTRILNMFAC